MARLAEGIGWNEKLFQVVVIVLLAHFFYIIEGEFPLAQAG